MFKELENNYLQHKRAEEISVRLHNKLEKRRSYFWKVVGNPPLLKPFAKILGSEWAPISLMVILTIGFFIAASVFAHSIGLIVLGMGLMFAMGFVKSHDEKLHAKKVRGIREFKRKFFHERQSAYDLLKNLDL